MSDLVPDRSRNNDLVQLILAQSVPIPREKQSRIWEMKAWCGEKIGEMRPYHPLQEAQEGWLDYFDGDWAVDYNPHDTGWLFWFARKSDRVLFQLTWS
jgi:hypothetical protein